jgi:hypothetical protein
VTKEGYWCQDETRIGLKTIERKRITARGVKPIGLVQGNFKAYYLYGVVAPQTGESFWLEFSHFDSQCFQIFLDNLAAEYPEHLNVVQLDNGKFHHSSQLKIPSGDFTGFSATLLSRVESNRESMAIHKTRTELGIV